MNGVDKLNKVKNFFFNPDNPIDSWINNKLLNGHDSLIDMAKEEMKHEWNNFWFYTIDDLLGVLAVAAIGYMMYTVIKYMFLNKNEDFQKILFSYFAFMLLRIFHTVLYFKFGM